MNISKARVVAVPLALAFGLFAGVRLSPAHAMSVDCHDAESIMLRAHASLVERTPSASGSIDRNFIGMEVALTKAQIAMASVERACGKSDPNREMAATVMEESEARMRLFRNQGTSF